jgi:hypothetical protein
MKYIKNIWIPPDLLKDKDGKWVHLVVEENDHFLYYYVDGKLEKTLKKNDKGGIDGKTP